MMYDLVFKNPFDSKFEYVSNVKMFHFSTIFTICVWFLIIERVCESKNTVINSEFTMSVLNQSLSTNILWFHQNIANDICQMLDFWL